jgi:hypothetical protein
VKGGPGCAIAEGTRASVGFAVFPSPFSSAEGRISTSETFQGTDHDERHRRTAARRKAT